MEIEIGIVFSCQMNSIVCDESLPKLASFLYSHVQSLQISADEHTVEGENYNKPFVVLWQGTVDHGSALMILGRKHESQFICVAFLLHNTPQIGLVPHCCLEGQTNCMPCIGLCCRAKTKLGNCTNFAHSNLNRPQIQVA
ncbi:hypothetical protein T06_5662 [Trichinella sp. T6]|nr:hypothetical protein T06_5662 [Trichinella sp. T6]